MTRLKITGLVASERSIDWRSITGEVPVVDLVGAVDEGARYCSVVSADGSYRASIPLSDIFAGGLLEVTLGGQPADGQGRGGVRLRVVDGTTLCWNVKDVGELRFTSEKEPDDIPARPSH